MLLDVAIDPALIQSLTRRQDQNRCHYDLMQRLGYRNPFSGQMVMRSLDYNLKRFGLGGKLNGMDGSMVYPAFQEGRMQDIITYCRDGDVASTAVLFERVAPWIIAPKLSIHNDANKTERI